MVPKKGAVTLKRNNNCNKDAANHFEFAASVIAFKLFCIRLKRDYANSEEFHKFYSIKCKEL